MGTLKAMPVMINGNQMSGPGIFDMKGGLTQMIFALKAVEALALETAVSPIILINSDEEIGSPESKVHIYHWAQRVDRAFIMEPALGLSGKLKTTRKGVGTFTISVAGKAAHAGLDPDKGVSAVLELSHVIQTLFGLNELERGISVNVGRIEGGLQPNVIAPQSKAVVDVRVPTAEDAERLEKSILGLRPSLTGTALKIEGGFRRPPLEQTPCNLALWQSARKLGREIGLDLEEAGAGGASDGNFTSVHTATLDGLGAVGDGAHARHEFIYLDKMIERTALLTLLLLLPPLSLNEGGS
jgi:glutamate carboxypeptidase